MNKILVFDMDGTIADFYGVEGWLEDLKNYSTRPYEIAQPVYEPTMLNNLIDMLKANGWRIVIVSWLSKDSNKEYDAAVRNAKRTWLEQIGFPYDEIHLVKYGTTKANCTRHLGGFQILVDDNEKVRRGWSQGCTIDARQDIIERLKDLI